MLSLRANFRLDYHMTTEIDDLREHYDRIRGVTLEHLARLSNEQLAFRPRPGAYSIGQQFLHIVQTEDFYIRGLSTAVWDTDRIRFPQTLPDVRDLAAQFAAVRGVTAAFLARLTIEQLSAVVPPVGGVSIYWSLRSWLWYLVEHEMHHKAQIAEAMRHLGLTPPFFAMVLPENARPDIQARADLGGV